MLGQVQPDYLILGRVDSVYIRLVQVMSGYS